MYRVAFCDFLFFLFVCFILVNLKWTKPTEQLSEIGKEFCEISTFALMFYTPGNAVGHSSDVDNEKENKTLQETRMIKSNTGSLSGAQKQEVMTI